MGLYNRRSRVIVLRLGYCAPCAVFVALVAHADADGTARGNLLVVDAIENAWKHRQNQLEHARFTWKERRTWPKGAISSTFGSELERRTPELKGSVMPLADTTTNLTYLLSISRESVRFEYDGKEWAADNQSLRDVKYVSVFNGKEGKDLYPSGVGHADWPVGVIRRASKYNDASLAALHPLLLFSRPLVSTLQPYDIKLRAMTLQAGQIVDGVECVALVQRLPRDSAIQFWLDPKRDFVIVKQLIMNEAIPREQIQISYQADSRLGWIPTAWKVVSHHHNGGLLCSASAVVTSTGSNPPVDPNLFTLEFPPGARVRNERTMEDYLLRPDGTKRMIMPEEVGATYAQMLNTSPGAALQDSNALWTGWKLAIVIIIGLSVLAVLFWRRFSVRKTN